MLKEAQASSEVENIITTHDKLYQALAAKSVTIDPSTKEVLQYREALLYGFEEIKKKGFLHTNGIVRIQAILEENKAGIRQLQGAYYRLLHEVRTKQNWEGWILLMLKAIEDTARKAIAQVNGITQIFNQIQ